MQEGFAFVALGRALIRDPDLVQRMQAGELTASRCVPCNLCVVEMDRGGTRCVLRDPGDQARASIGSDSKRRTNGPGA